MQKKRILLIDDEPDITGLLKLNLENTGTYEVREENRAEHALATARTFKPDLIVLDLVMPNVDGVEVAAQLKADKALKETPLVFLTAVATKAEASDKGGTIGGHPFIAKPASQEELIESIEKYLPRGTEQGGPPEKKSEQTETPPMQKKRILIVDDDPDITGLLKLNLENTGAYEVRGENRSEHALASARAFRPDFVILDLMMPNVMGGNIARQLKADEDFKDTPVVFISATVTEDARPHGGSTIAGRPAIPKPVSTEEVIRLIEKYLPKEADKGAGPKKKSEQAEATPIQKKRILLIDDEEDLTMVLKLSIEKSSEYEALVANSGEAGLEAVKMHKPDLVFLDIMMPGMDGLKTLKRIKAIAPDLPVAMLTASWKEEQAIQCFKAGAYDYILKPADFEFLKTTLLAKLF